MDQHPVPQDITGFQFKLVGDMTLKQFGYLAAGAIVAWVFYISGWNPIIKIPLAFFSFVFGIALAFLPIQERPLETWIINFFKSVYKPTQYLWKKSVTKLDFLGDAIVADKPLAQEPLTTLNPQPTSEEKLKEYLDTIVTVDDLIARQQEPPPIIETPSEKTLDINELLKQRENSDFKINQELGRVADEVKPPTIDDLAEGRKDLKPSAVIETLHKLDETGAINKKLASEISGLNTKMMALAQEHKNKDEENSEYKTQLENMKQITETLKAEKDAMMAEMDRLLKELKQAQKGVRPIDPDARVKFMDKMPIQGAPTDGTIPPNTVHGLIDDRAGQAISGVIVLIKNAQGSPVRALRTNKLGQFFATTPLESGTYYIELEKDGYQFDTVEIKLVGESLSPISIKAK
ncbi:MAG: PrgI family protein [bacterium]|nr:PrgI family protein [bacterium]